MNIYPCLQIEVMNVHLNNSEAKRETCEASLSDALSQINCVQEDLQVQEGSYRSQLSTMSEHVANMNEKLIQKTEEIDQLKFELSQKVRSKFLAFFPLESTAWTYVTSFQESRRRKQWYFYTSNDEQTRHSRCDDTRCETSSIEELGLLAFAFKKKRGSHGNQSSYFTRQLWQSGCCLNFNLPSKCCSAEQKPCALKLLTHFIIL